VLAVFLMVESFSRQRFLFASLAASAFLIYLDPEHGTNRIRTLMIAQLSAAVLGLLTYMSLGPGYLSGAAAMIITIVLMILLDALHPPAVSTSLIFAFRAGHETNLFLFALAVAMTAGLVLLERSALWLFTRHRHPQRVRK
jgi:CBS-domain-containing membrane protein